VSLSPPVEHLATIAPSAASGRGVAKLKCSFTPCRLQHLPHSRLPVGILMHVVACARCRDWWNPEDAVQEAADSYDHKHGRLSEKVSAPFPQRCIGTNEHFLVQVAARPHFHVLVQQASRSLHGLELCLTDDRAQKKFNAAMFELRANRLVVQPVRLGQHAQRKSWGVMREEHPLRLELVSAHRPIKSGAGRGCE
jgi:hypothetical protein